MDKIAEGKARGRELLYFDTLLKIARAYMRPDKLRRRAEKDYGVSYEEALEMAYENIQAEAAAAIYGKRRPKIYSMKPTEKPTEALAESAAHAEVGEEKKFL
jgi:hypothetical protein